MNNKIILLSSLILICSFSNGFCDSQKVSNVNAQIEMLQSEIETLDHESNPEKNEIGKSILKTNVQYLQSVIFSKIKKATAKLEKYKECLNDSQDGTEVQMWLKKIKSTEEKIRNLNDTLVGIDLIKTRLN